MTQLIKTDEQVFRLDISDNDMVAVYLYDELITTLKRRKKQIYVNSFIKV